MPADTSRAIGAVTELLSTKLSEHTSVAIVTQGRPEPRPDQTQARLNVFLYETLVDGHLRSHALDSGRPAPVWLALRYLITAYTTGGDSDSSAAHRSLGEAIRAVHDLGYLPVEGLMELDDELALRASPEPLKVSLIPTSSDLLGRLMQGTDEKYRCSIAIEVRPVMIASTATSEDALLVGVRYQTAPPGAPPPGVRIVLDTEVAPQLARAVPSAFAAGEIVRLIGTGFGAGDFARLGASTIPITAGSAIIAAGTRAGALPLAVGRTLASGRVRTSEPIIVRLLPALASASVASTSPDPDAEPGRLVVQLALTGDLLGLAEDDVLVALWAGHTVASSDELVGPDQTTRTATLRNVPPGTYRVIVRVNGGQAMASPQVVIA